MKLRKGFVSNSSSSSYIVNTEKISRWDEPLTIPYIARIMIAIRGYSSDSELISKLDEYLRSGKINKNTPLKFESSNYETYIWKVGEDIYIDTCNNHPFYYLEFLNCIGDGHDNVPDEGTFFSLKYGDFGYENHCYGGSHKMRTWFSKVEEPCPKCGRIPYRN